MLVSHDHKFILLRTRKTASTSVEMFLQPFCTPENTPIVEHGEAIVSEHGIVGQRLGDKRHSLPVTPGVPRNVWFSHHGADSLKEKIGDEIWNSYTKISIVRNPFQKALSSFTWSARERIDSLTDTQKVRQFRKKVNARRYKDDKDIVFTNLESNTPEFAPDILIRTEYLVEDLTKLCATLELDETKTELPHAKSTGKKRSSIPLAEWYDEETISSVQEHLDWMFKYGDYPDTPV